MNTEVELMPAFGGDGYWQRRRAWFKTNDALAWYVRRHHARLIEAGALLKHAGRWFVNPQRFDQEVVAIAGDEARRTVGSAA